MIILIWTIVEPDYIQNRSARLWKIIWTFKKSSDSIVTSKYRMKIDTKYLHLSFYRGNRVASQSSLLLTSTVGEMICLIVINYFLTRQLGTEKYGIYSLLINIFTFSKVIFNFGFFQSAGRIVATTKDDVKCRHIYAAAIAICFVLDLLMNISIIIFLCLFNEYRYLLPILLITIPFNWIYLMQERFIKYQYQD